LYAFHTTITNSVVFWYELVGNMNCIQLDLFRTDEESEIIELRKEIVAIRESTSKVRKKLFGEHGKLVKRMTDQESRLQILERHICRPECIDLNFTI